MIYDLTIDRALILLINKKANVIQKHDGEKYKLEDNILVSTRGNVPCIIDITDRWRVLR